MDAVVGSDFPLATTLSGNTLQSSGVALLGERYIAVGTFSYLVFASMNLSQFSLQIDILDSSYAFTLQVYHARSGPAPGNSATDDRLLKCLT